jgi:hypothetical protein
MSQILYMTNIFATMLYLTFIKSDAVLCDMHKCKKNIVRWATMHRIWKEKMRQQKFGNPEAL